jgi:hypothetical protein
MGLHRDARITVTGAGVSTAYSPDKPKSRPMVGRKAAQRLSRYCARSFSQVLNGVARRNELLRKRAHQVSVLVEITFLWRPGAARPRFSLFCKIQTP